MYFIVYVCELCSSLDTTYKEVFMQVHLVTIWGPPCNTWFGVPHDSVHKGHWRYLSCLCRIPTVIRFVSSSISFLFSPALRQKRTCEMHLDTSLLFRRALLTPSPPPRCVWPYEKRWYLAKTYLLQKKLNTITKPHGFWATKFHMVTPDVRVSSVWD